MREIAPSPANGPANNPGPALQAASATMTPTPAPAPAPQQTAAPQAQPQGGMADQLKQSPRYQEMLQQVSQFIDQVGPEQQNMIDQSRQQQQAARQQKIPANSPEAQALAPLAKFFKSNGRLPTPDELRQVSAMDALRQQLGREPTQTELQLWVSKPPKF